MGTSKNMEMHQVDVTTTFLYAPLEEEVYMQQPEGTMQLGDEGKMMRLLKCLYGLEQAPRPFDTFTSTLFWSSWVLWGWNQISEFTWRGKVKISYTLLLLVPPRPNSFGCRWYVSSGAKAGEDQGVEGGFACWVQDERFGGGKILIGENNIYLEWLSSLLMPPWYHSLD